MSPAPRMLRIAIIEQNDLMRRGLESLFAGGRDLEVVAVVAKAADVAEVNGDLDAIVYGVPSYADPGLSDTITTLSARARVLVVAEFAGRQLVTDVLKAGAFGCASKQASAAELIRAVDTVGRNSVYIASGLAARLLAELRRPATAPHPALAQREAEALRLLATGLTHSQIGRQMGLTEATVSTYIKRIRNKLSVGNKADLTRKAIELGLLGDGKGSHSETHWPPAA